MPNKRLNKTIARTSLVLIRDDSSPGGIPGMGVYTTGRRIVTAAHVLPDFERPMAGVGGNFVRVMVSPFNMPNLQVRTFVAFTDPFADAAVLDDNAESWDDMDREGWELLDKVCTPAQIQKDVPAWDADEIPAQVCTRDDHWLEGKVIPVGDLRTLSGEFDGPVKRGTSGSPVFNNLGQVMGVISTSTEVPSDNGDGWEYEPFAHVVSLGAALLPRWFFFPSRKVDDDDRPR